jgi:hypothetical protein
MADARRKELDFFQGSPHYGGLKNVGTGFLSGKLSSHLIGAIRKQLPVIQHSINDGIIDMERELAALGGPGATTRGAMVHLVLQVRRAGRRPRCMPWSAPGVGPSDALGAPGVAWRRCLRGLNPRAYAALVTDSRMDLALCCRYARAALPGMQ